MDKEKLKVILIEHAYVSTIRQCRCQGDEDLQVRSLAKDWQGFPVYGIQAWAEHVAMLIEGIK